MLFYPCVHFLAWWRPWLIGEGDVAWTELFKAAENKGRVEHGAGA
jgi:hypothetical protein